MRPPNKPPSKPGRFSLPRVCAILTSALHCRGIDARYGRIDFASIRSLARMGLTVRDFARNFVRLAIGEGVAALALHAVAATAATVASVSTLVLLSTIVRTHGAALRSHPVLVVVIGAAAIVWLFAAATVVVLAFRRRSQLPTIPYEFHITEKEIHYEYRDLRNLTYRKRVVLKALKGGATLYCDRYRWSGTGSISVRSTVNDHEFRETGRQGLWRFYEIRFPRALSANEVIETELVWTLEDMEHTAVPFVSATIEESTDLLSLTLQLPRELHATQVVCEASPFMGAKNPYSTKSAPLDLHHAHTWRIVKPLQYWYYEVRLPTHLVAP
jgi:hypothetical protein